MSHNFWMYITKDFSRIRRLNKETFLKVYELLSQHIVRIFMAHLHNEDKSRKWSLTVDFLESDS